MDNRTFRPFELGSVVSTPEALRLLGREGILALLRRHASGDWGDLTDEDRRANDEALLSGDRILSRYDVGDDSFYVITEADRSSTCCLRREEY
jgi:hypothetical protein